MALFARSFTGVFTLAPRAGQAWRLVNGLKRSGNEGNLRVSCEMLLVSSRSLCAEGPLHDLPDFAFADGRPAPETKTQRRWKRRRQAEIDEIARLRAEMAGKEELYTVRNVDKY